MTVNEFSLHIVTPILQKVIHEIQKLDALFALVADKSAAGSLTSHAKGQSGVTRSASIEAFLFFISQLCLFL